MFGFTNKEQGVILFLCACFVFGLGLQGIQKHKSPSAETPSKGIGVEEAASHQTSDTTSFFIVALNTADPRLLEQLPGVGPVLAKRIYDYREQNGRFQAVEDLMKIKGIGKKTFEKIRPFIRCD
jgi:comEA protein